MALAWVLIFLIALTVIVKGADWLLESSEKIGLALGMSPFVIGVLIVGIGTSFPELIASIAAAFRGVTEIITANAVGSNITNILLIIGISAVVGKKLVVTKSLIDLDLPMLAVGTVLFLGVAWDRQVTQIEAILLVISYLIYLLYTIFHKDDDDEDTKERKEIIDVGMKKRHIVSSYKEEKTKNKHKLKTRQFLMLAMGIICLAVGAKYLVDSVIKLSEIFDVSPAIISITAVAIGTSLPELIVSVRAALSGKSEVAIGNIFGSNAFNVLMVIGLPGIFMKLSIDDSTFMIGIPVMAMATLLFIISGISKRIHLWDGAMFLILYILFIGKLFKLF